MTITQSFKTCMFDKYATFSGRASRSEYWWFILSCIAISFLLSAVLGFSFGVTIGLSSSIWGLDFNEQSASLGSALLGFFSIFSFSNSCA